MKKLLLIYNPHAGKGQIKARLSRIIEIFEEHGYLTTAYATQGRGDGVWAAAAMARDFDHIVVGGGDGTLSEVITGLPQDCRNRNIGYLPAGTTNDFSRTLALPGDDLEEAARLAVAGRAQRCDIGLVNDHHILTYVAAFGAFSDTSYATPAEVCDTLWAAYEAYQEAPWDGPRMMLCPRSLYPTLPLAEADGNETVGITARDGRHLIVHGHKAVGEALRRGDVYLRAELAEGDVARVSDAELAAYEAAYGIHYAK